MLFFFGIKNTGVKSGVVESTCESCNQSKHFVHIFQKYFHIFWIPTFPLGKQSALVCAHCLKATVEKEMSTQQKHITRPTRKAANTPAYTFAGLILLACLIGWGKYTNNQEMGRTQTFVAAPVVNDLAVIKSNKNEYLILKLVSVEGDTLKFVPGNYAYKSSFSAKREIQKKGVEESDYFSDKPLEMSKMKYKELKVDFVQRDNLSEEL